MMQVICNKCGSQYNLSDEKAWGTGTCKCWERIQVPMNISNQPVNHITKNSKKYIFTELLLWFAICISLYMVVWFITIILTRIWWIPSYIITSVNIVSLLIIFLISMHYWRKNEKFVIIWIIIAFIIVKIIIYSIYQAQIEKSKRFLQQYQNEIVKNNKIIDEIENSNEGYYKSVRPTINKTNDEIILHEIIESINFTKGKTEFKWTDVNCSNERIIDWEKNMATILCTFYGYSIMGKAIENSAEKFISELSKNIKVADYHIAISNKDDFLKQAKNMIDYSSSDNGIKSLFSKQALTKIEFTY